jgi:hypothetical protein
MEMTVFDDETLRQALRRRLLALRKVAVLVASAHEEIPEALGIPRPTAELRAWARALLDRVEEGEFIEAWDQAGLAAGDIEREIAGLAGHHSDADLAAVAELLSRPREGDLSDWDRALWSVRRGDPTNVPLPDGVREPLAGVLASRPGRVRIRSRTPGEIDDWEHSFWLKHDVEAETVAFEVLELREINAILKEVVQKLDRVQQSAFEGWANAELATYEPNPRPAIWPALARVSLPVT